MSGIRSVLVVGSAVAALVLVGGATAREAAPVTPIGASLSSPGAVARYLTSLGIDPKRVVVQRGAGNYAGSSCPGAGWTCTSTSHPVVQIAPSGGRNVFRCATARCAVVQVSTAALATNTASCIRKTGEQEDQGNPITQTCLITQSGAAANKAVVFEKAKKLRGLTQDVSQTAQIVQLATGPGSGNTACVSQVLILSVSPRPQGAVTESSNGHQLISIKQDSPSGSNLVGNAKATDENAACDSANPMTQSQTISQTATSSGGIAQNENATGSGPNSLIDVEQNQSTPSASGANSSSFNQSSSLTAQAYTPAGPVSQTQSSAGGGLKATVNQLSTGLSTSSATQTETQTEDADKSSSDGTLPTGALTQTQYGPVRCCSNQVSNSSDMFTINQSSTQDNDTQQNQTNTVAADCSSTGNCIVTQMTTVDGSSTTNTQTGASVSTSINCTGSTCTTPTSTFDGSRGTGSLSTLGPVRHEVVRSR